MMKYHQDSEGMYNNIFFIVSWQTNRWKGLFTFFYYPHNKTSSGNGDEMFFCINVLIHFWHKKKTVHNRYITALNWNVCYHVKKKKTNNNIFIYFLKFPLTWTCCPVISSISFVPLDTLICILGYGLGLFLTAELLQLGSSKDISL